MYQITIYNEPFSQVVETLLGIYRSYFELVRKNKEYEGKVAVFIIADGYDKLSDEFLKACTKAGIFDINMM